MEDLAYLRDRWIDKKVIAYSREAFGTEEGRFIRVHSISHQWIEVETLNGDKTPTRDIYLIPMMHIILKARGDKDG